MHGRLPKQSQTSRRLFIGVHEVQRQKEKTNGLLPFKVDDIQPDGPYSFPNKRKKSIGSRDIREPNLLFFSDKFLVSHLRRGIVYLGD